MPYIIKKVKEKGEQGYKVCKRDEPKRCFSGHPLSKERAEKQRTAIILSEMGKSRITGGVRDTAAEQGEATTPEGGPITNHQSPPRVPQRTAAPPELQAARAAARPPRTGAIFLPIPPASPPEQAAIEGPLQPARSRRSSDEAGPSQPSLIIRNTTVDASFTKEHCRAFFTKPKAKPINPMTGKEIKRYEKTFNDIIMKCYNIMDKDEFARAVDEAKFKKDEIEKIVGKLEKIKERESKAAMSEEDICRTFMRNPTKNPKNGKIIKVPDEPYDEMYTMCENVLGKEEMDRLMDEYIEEIMPTADKKETARKCERMINMSRYLEYDEDDGTIGNELHIGNIFSEMQKNNKNDTFYAEHPFAKKLLKKCDDNFLMKMLFVTTVKSPSTINLNRSIVRYIVRYDAGNPNRFRIEIANIYDIVRNISEYIARFSNDIESKVTLLDSLQKTVVTILEMSTSDIAEAKREKKIYIEDRYRRDIQSCILELEAIKQGVRLVEFEDSSSARTSNRSKSRSIKEGLPVLPKKTRAEVLAELGNTCRIMKDFISFDDFEDMKKKKLQLVVKIGAKTMEDGKEKQSCYYVDNIYKFVDNELRNSKVPKDPLTKTIITSKEVDDAILPLMKYVDIAAINPYLKNREQKIPDIRLSIGSHINDDGRNFFSVGYIRRITSTAEDHTYANPFGYIPTNIYVDEADRGDEPPDESDVFTGSTDISSTVIMAKLAQLHERGMLTDMYGKPRVHINKKIEYWYDTKAEIVKKANKMIAEFDNFLR